MSFGSKRALLLAAVPFVAFAQPAQADIVIGPRFSYYFDNSNLRTSNQTSFDDVGANRVSELEELFEQTQDISPTIIAEDPSSSVLADQIAFPMYGAMINFGNDRDRVTLTGMYGRGKGEARTVTQRRLIGLFGAGGTTITDFEVSNFVASNSIDRIDVEGTWQRRLNENLALNAGVRYERLDVKVVGLETIDSTNQIIAFAFDDPFLLFEDGLRGDSTGEQTIQTFSIRAGGTAFVPLDNNFNVFLSGMLQGSYQPSSRLVGSAEFPTRDEPLFFDIDERNPSELSVGPDIAVGGQLIIFDNLALDLRYRAVIFFPVTGEFEFTDARVNHGVNVGLSLRL